MRLPDSMARAVAAALLAAAAPSSATAGYSWQPTSLREDFLRDFAQAGDTLLGGSATAGLMASLDGGRNWSRVPACYDGNVNAVSALQASEGQIVAAFETAGICVKRPGSAVWEEAVEGLPPQPFLQDLIRVGNILIAGGKHVTGGAVAYRARAGGGPWVQSSAGMQPGVRRVERFALGSGGVVFAGISQIRAPSAAFLYLSRDTGVTWSPAAGRLPAPVQDLLWAEGYLLAATAGGVFRTRDQGATWEDCGPEFTSGASYALAGYGGLVYAGSGNVVFRSRDAGGSWVALEAGLPGKESAVSSLWAGPSAVLAGMGPWYGVWRLEGAVRLGWPLSEPATRGRQDAFRDVLGRAGKGADRAAVRFPLGFRLEP